MKPSHIACLIFLLVAGLTCPGLVRAMDGDYVSYFTLPETPVTNGPVPLQAAWYANTTPNSQGGVLIVGAELVTDRTHDNIAYQLSQYGWSTLIIQLPDLPKPPDPLSRAEPADPEDSMDENAAAPPVDPPLLSDTEYVRAAITHLQTTRNLYNLVLLNSDSGWQRLQATETTPAAYADFQGYILFKVDSPGSLTPLSAVAPILDLVDRLSARDFHSDRKLDARRNQRSNYQTVELTMTPWQMQPRVERFSRRIRGWLKVNMQGVEFNGG